MQRKSFLLIVQSPDLQPEHKNILEAVQHHSLGDFIEVFKETSAPRGSRATGFATPFTVAYMFSTESPPSQMGFGLLNGDHYLLLELGDRCWIDGYARVRSWLDRHQE